MPDTALAAMKDETEPNPRCPICTAIRDPKSEIGALGYQSIRDPRFSYARCRQCGAVFVHPMPSPEMLYAHYQDPAYFAGNAEQGYQDYAAIRKALVPHFRRRLRTLSRYHAPPGRLLDFGCADGFFLELARARGWEIAGVELAQKMARQTAQRLQVPIVHDVEALPFPPEHLFDAITMWEVIEHLPDPVAVLARLRRRLRPSGILMLSTPNAGHWQAIREPEAWAAFRPPSHLVLFTQKALALALERAGFIPIVIRGTAPLPSLPTWLRRVTAPLQQSITTGQARPWPLALGLWRAVRLLGWGWHLLAHRQQDLFATLEAIAQCPP